MKVSFPERVTPGYDRSKALWTCCECGEHKNENAMEVVLGWPGSRRFRYDEPDWVCHECLTEAQAAGATWNEYCKDCWHAMESLLAQFHTPLERCPLDADRSPEQ